MKKDMRSRIVNILVSVMLVISVIGIILMSEEGPVFGAIVILVILGGTVLLMVCLTAIAFIVNSIRSRRIVKRMERYRKKYVTSVEFETETFGTLSFFVDSCLNRAYAQFYDSDGIVSAGREVGIEIDVKNDEMYILRSLGILSELTENYNEYFEEANRAIVESTDYNEGLLDIDEISVVSEDDGEMYVMLVCDLYSVTFTCCFDDETATPKIGGNPQVQPY